MLADADLLLLFTETVRVKEEEKSHLSFSVFNIKTVTLRRVNPSLLLEHI